MISRTCPKCGQTWYSADEKGTWNCSNCGAEIPPITEESQTIQDYVN
ncbi:MAG: hypothetical protein ACOY46_16295 [Bacillota bacterium]